MRWISRQGKARRGMFVCMCICMCLCMFSVRACVWVRFPRQAAAHAELCGQQSKTWAGTCVSACAHVLGKKQKKTIIKVIFFKYIFCLSFPPQAIAKAMNKQHHSLTHGLLAGLPVTQVVTTNYDRLFECASQGSGTFNSVWGRVKISQCIRAYVWVVVS